MEANANFPNEQLIENDKESSVTTIIHKLIRNEEYEEQKQSYGKPKLAGGANKKGYTKKPRNPTGKWH